VTSSGAPDAGGPLAGILVVGVEQSVAGPLCTRILGDLGATVIKVEPSSGDFSRGWDEHAAGESAQFWWLNRRKRSIAVDLREAAGRKILETLLGHADVLVHNMSPRAAERLGLTGEAARERYPELVNCQISGYGDTTSCRDRKAYDMLVQAECGVMSLTGTPERPARVGVSISDVSSGIYAALLVLAALYERRDTGHGRTLDVSMFDVTAEFTAPMLVSYLNSGVLYPRLCDQHHAIAPYGVFFSADGHGILLAVHQDVEWARLCEQLLGAPELARDPRFATNASRVEHRAEVGATVSAAFAAHTRHELRNRLQELGLAYAEVNDIASVATHPALLERGIVTAVESASGATVSTVSGIAERTFGATVTGRLRPPSIGEDTDEVLRELLAGATRKGGA
jgi:itaconate CoA-transferase